MPIDKKLKFLLSKLSIYHSKTIQITEPLHVVTRLINYAFISQEVVILITLNCNNSIINTHELFRGTVNHCMTHPRDIFRTAIIDNAVAIILVHNHPSGKLDFSEEDKKFTDTINGAGELMKIPVLDHIILSPIGYNSIVGLEPVLFKDIKTTEKYNLKNYSKSQKNL